MKKYISLKEKEENRKKREKARRKKREEIKEKWRQEDDPAKKKKLLREMNKLLPFKGGSIRTVSGGLPGLGKRK